MVKGTIIKGVGGFYYVGTGNGIYECRARGKFRKERITPTVGDYAEITVIDEENKKGSLDNILSRKTYMIRPRVANVDQVIIIFAAAKPQLDPDMLDRFLILAEEQGLDIVICINKIDLDPDEEYKKYADIYSSAGYRVIPVSAEKKINIEQLGDCLKDKISVVAGPSGVGKSSIINSLNPNLRLETGSVSRKIERGKHTTRHAQLMELYGNSFIVDSPGFTSLYIDNIKPEMLQEYFPEFTPYIGKCRFSSCVHIHEPDCNVKNNVGESINPARYDRYVKLYNELVEFENERKR